MSEVLANVTVPVPGQQHHNASAVFLQQARELVIATNEDYSGAAVALKSLKAAAGRIEEERKKLKAPILDAGRAIDAFFGDPLHTLEIAEKEIKRKLVVYENEQDKKRREEQAKADAQARKEREALEERARKAADSGKTEKAAQLQVQAATVVAPVVDRAPPQVAGIKYRDVAKFEVTDPNAIPRSYLSVDESKIRKVVQALKTEANIPGVRVWIEKEIAAGSA